MSQAPFTSEQNERIHRLMDKMHWALVKVDNVVAETLTLIQARERYSDTRQAVGKYRTRMEALRLISEEIWAHKNQFDMELIRECGCNGSCKKKIQ